MAEKPPPRQKNWAPAGRAARLEDVDPEGQRAIKQNWADMGMLTQHIGEAKAKAKASMTKSSVGTLGRKKAEVRTRALAAAGPHLVDKPLTVEGATQARVERVQQGRQRAKEAGSWTHKETGWKMDPVPEGTGWYFSHHAEIASAAREHGIDRDRAITATTAMSPENSPTIERRAGRAMMDMVGHQDEHTVHVTPELHARANEKIGGSDLKGQAMPDDWVGKHVKLSDMRSEHIAGVAAVAAEMRKKGRPVQSTAPFEDLGAARKAGPARRAIEHLRGERSEEDTIDPHSAPKVWSYKETTKESVPGSATHLEYLARGMDFQRGKGQQRRTPRGMHAETEPQRTGRQAQAASLHQQAGAAQPGSTEQALAHLKLGALGLRQTRAGRTTIPDIRPQRKSQEGVLSPQAHTAEDTWMHSISTEQDPRSVKAGGPRSRTSIAKTAASDPDLASEKRMGKTASTGEKVAPEGRIGNAALNHALNNYATRSAATQLGLPATMTQETGWSEQRIRADKSPEYKRQQAERSLPRQPPGLGRQFPGASPNPVTPIDHAASKKLYDRVVGGGPAASTKEIKQVQRLQKKRSA